NRTGSMQKDFSSVRIVEAAPEQESFDMQGARKRARWRVEDVQQIEVSGDTGRGAIEDHDRPFLSMGQETLTEGGVERGLPVFRNIQTNLRLHRSDQGEGGESNSEPRETLSCLHESLLTESARRAIESRRALAVGA